MLTLFRPRACVRVFVCLLVCWHFSVVARIGGTQRGWIHLADTPPPLVLIYQFSISISGRSEACAHLIYDFSNATQLQANGNVWCSARPGLERTYACCRMDLTILRPSAWPRTPVARRRIQAASGPSFHLVRRSMLIIWIKILLIIAAQ